jgi:hypothetical protein
VTGSESDFVAVSAGYFLAESFSAGSLAAGEQYLTAVWQTEREQKNLPAGCEVEEADMSAVGLNSVCSAAEQEELSTAVEQAVVSAAAQAVVSAVEQAAASAEWEEQYTAAGKVAALEQHELKLSAVSLPGKKNCSPEEQRLVE